MPTPELINKEHFVDSSSNKKQTLTIFHMEDDPIAKGVTDQADALKPQTF